jgi:hypothetical protein
MFQFDEIRPQPPGPERESKWISDCRLQIAELPFNQPYVSSPRTFLGFLDSELDALAFPEQLEHRTPHGAAMKEMLQARFIPDESKAFVD